MASSINGFGTAYYGRRRRRPDGSFIATRWLIAAALPIIPLGSARLKPLREGFFRQTYAELESLGMDWVQVIATYFYVYAMGLWCLHRQVVKTPEAPAWCPPALAFAYAFWPMALLVITPHVVRAFSKERAPGRRPSNRGSTGDHAGRR